MISIGNDRGCTAKFGSFPDILVSLHGLHRLGFHSLGIKRLINKPSLYHWILIAKRDFTLEEIRYCFKSSAYQSMYNLMAIYTLIPAGNRQELKSKVGNLTYYRSVCDGTLRGLSWVSAVYFYVDSGIVSSMQSPILLFSSRVTPFLINYWSSAFVSLLRRGFLELDVSYFRFRLGTFRINPVDLEDISQ
jgi:hypothetical protein